MRTKHKLRQRRIRKAAVSLLATGATLALVGALSPVMAETPPDPAALSQTSETAEPSETKPDAQVQAPAEKSPEQSSTEPSGDASSPSDANASDPNAEPNQESASAGEPARATTQSDATGQSVGIASVPSPGSGEAVITVKVGGDRSGTGLTQVSPLAGVRLALFKGNNNGPTNQVSESWGTCTSDAGGDCSFTVPDTSFWGGKNYGERFWIKQLSAPAGWYMNAELATGGTTSSNAYQFRTSAVSAGNTYTSTANFMQTESGTEQSSGVWQNSRNNNSLVQKCGLDVAMVLDLSGSVGSSLPSLKQAANTFVDSLKGTPSRMAVFSFAADSPAAGGGNNPALTSVASDAGATAVKSTYSGWTSGGATNWDRALTTVANASQRYDVVVVITDGNPTYWGSPPAGAGSSTYFRYVEHGIFGANSIKAEGARVVAVGVGDGVTNAATSRNLAAISGPSKYNGSNSSTADYYQESSYSAAGAALKQLALGNCAGSLTVVKQIVPSGNTGNDTTGSTKGSGWAMTATSSTTGVGGVPATKTTDAATGSANFPLTFAGGVNSGSVTVREAQQSDHTLIRKDSTGQNAICTNVGTGANIVPTNVGTPSDANPGFTIDVPSTAAVSCVIYNKQIAKGDVTVDKTWVVNGQSYANGEQPAGLSAQLKLTGPGGAAASDQPWGVAREGYVQPSSATVSETVSLAPGCTLTSSKVTKVNGGNVSANLPYALSVDRAKVTAMVTNTVDCPVQLRIEKRDKDTNNLISGTTAGATFTITPNPSTGSGTMTATDGGANDADSTVNGVIEFTNAKAGTYTIVETVAPTGYALPSPAADRTVTKTVTVPGSAGKATFTYLDSRLWAAPTVTKDARATYDSAYFWNIKKEVAPLVGQTPGEYVDGQATQTVPAGSTAHFRYKISVGQVREDRTNYRVTNGAEGITLSNSNSAPMVLTLSDSTQGVACTFPAGTDIDSTTPGVQVSVPAHGSKKITYTCALGDAPSSTSGGTNVATVTWSKASYPQNQTDVDKGADAGTGSVSGSANYTFVQAGAANKTITVTDDKHTFSPAWTVTWGDPSSSLSRTYDVPVLAPAGTCTPTMVNTAKIVETGQSDTASTKVCGGADLKVEKNKTVSLTRSYGWDIEKRRTSDASVTVGPDGKATADYSVTVKRAPGQGYQDSGWLMTGKITVTNPNDWQDITLTGIIDAYPGSTCTVDQGASLTIPKSGSRTFDYSCTFADKPAYDGTNIAMVTWDSLTAHTASGTAIGTKHVAAADWSKTLVNKTVTVTDPAYTEGNGVLGTVDWDDAPKSFTYSAEWSGQAGTCVTHTNTATIEETEQSASADVQVCQPVGLTATKTVTEAKKDRRYDWKVTKEVKNSAGQWVDSSTWTGDSYSHDFEYRVKVEPNRTQANPDGFTDENYRLAGTITVSNPNTSDQIAPITATVTDVPGVGGGVSCLVEGEASHEVTVASGKNAVLDYSCTFTGTPANGKNLATVTWDAGNKAVSPQPGADVSFGVDRQINQTVTVYDDEATGATKTRTLGTATWDETTTFPTYEVAHTAAGLDCQAAGNRFVNTATVFGDNALAPLDGDTATAIICPNAATWKVVKTSTPAEGARVNPGTSIDYTLTVTHTGGVPATDIVVSDDLSSMIPADAGFGGVQGSPAGTVDVPSAANGQTLTWTVPSLASGSTSLTFRVDIAADAYDKTLHNVVTAPGSTNCQEDSDDPDCDTTHTTKKQPQLTLVKVVDANGTGTTVQPSAWDLTADGAGAAVDMTAVKSGTQAKITPNVDYVLSESGGPSGFTPSAWTCDRGMSAGVVKLSYDEVATCTITNTAVKPKLTLDKIVDNNADAGATGVKADWHLVGDNAATADVDVEGNGHASGEVKVGTYQLSETLRAGGPAGYTDGTTWDCGPNQAAVTSVTLVPGDDVTCTITNTAVKGTWKIDKSADPKDGATVEPGDTVTYTLTAKKTGGVDPTDVVVTDDLSAVLPHVAGGTVTGITASAGTAALDGSTLKWTIPSLSGTQTVSYQVTVASDAWGVSLRNVVTSTGSQGCLTDCDTTHPTPAYDLEKTTDGPARVAPGDTVTYHLKVSNTSDAVLDGAVVTDNLAGLEFTSSPTITAGTGGSISGSTLTWNVPELAPHTSSTLTYTVVVNDDAFDKTIRNVATPGDGGTCVEADDCTTTHTTKDQPKLTLVKVVDNGTTAGNATARDFILTATGPETVSGPGAGQGQVDAAKVKAGSYSLTESGPRHYTQGAWMCRDNPQGAWEQAGEPGNAGSVALALDEDVTCQVRNTADVASYTIAKSSPSDETTVMPGDTITYTLTAKWRDGVRLADVKVSDDLTQVLPFVDGGVTAITPSSGTASVTGNTLVWTIPELSDTDGERQATLTYQVKLRSDAWSAQLKNVVTPTTPGGTCEAGNDCQTVESTPDKPKLELVKSVVNGVNPTATADDWVLKATPGQGVDQRQSEVAGPGGVAATAVWPGTYSLAEAANPDGDGDTDGYTASAWQCRDRGTTTTAAGSSLSLEPGDDVICTITNTQDAAFTVAKASDPASDQVVTPGQVITYTVTATHTAGVDPTGVTVTDTMGGVPDYGTLDEDSFEVDGVAAPAGAVTVAGDKHSFVWDVGALAGTKRLTYRVSVTEAALGHTLENVITSPGSQTCPPGAGVARLIAAAAVGDGCSTTHPVPSWTLEKGSDPETGSVVDPGSDIAYTLTVRNTGDSVLSGATVQDDLSAVLDNATLVTAFPTSGAEGPATYDEATQMIAWAVADVPVDGSVSLTYTVRVGNDADGVVLRNLAAVAPPTTDNPVNETGACVAPDGCQTEHGTPVVEPPVVEPPVVEPPVVEPPVVEPPVVEPPVVEPPQAAPPAQPTALPDTGGPAFGYLPAGIGLLLLGAWLLFMSRRRESAE